MNLTKLLAKSIKNGGTTLIEHSTNTANIASYLCDFLNTKETIKNITIITALLHDIGKCVKPFQDYILSLDKEVEDVEGIVAEESTIINYPHNIIGYVFLSMIDLDFVDMHDIDNDKDFISNSIIFHHLIDGKYKEKTLEVIDSLSKDDMNTMYDFIENVIKIADSKFSINLTYNKVNGKRHIDIPNGQYSFNNKNYIYMFIKSIIVSADRLASKYEKEGIEITKENISSRYYTDCIYNDINPSFEDLDIERFNNQKDLINRICTHNTTVLTAPAGYGKTILGLLWNNKLANNKKLYWVTPTNSIARNVYKTLIEELKTFGFDTNMSVGLLIASNYEEGNENSNIIVTNIDNWLHPTYKNSKGIGYFDLLYNNLVFDEFHNLVSSDAYYSAFIILMKTRNELCKNSYSLLLSATPITPLLSKIESFESKVYKEPTCQSQNYKQQYHFKLHTSLNDIDLTNLDNSLVVFNSIKKSQSIFHSINKIHEDILYHSDFTKSDQLSKFDDLMKHHGKKNIKEKKYPFNNAIGTRCINTSLNISYKYGIESISSPEHTIQFIGRLGRFSEFKDEIINVDIINLLIKKGKQGEKGETAAIEIIYDKVLCQLWFDFLLKNVDDKVITNEQLYELYNKFQVEQSIEIQRFLEEKYRQSLDKLNNVGVYRYSFGDGNKKNKSIRGNNFSLYYIAALNGTEEYMKECLSDNYDAFKMPSTKLERDIATMRNNLNNTLINILRKIYHNGREEDYGLKWTFEEAKRRYKNGQTSKFIKFLELAKKEETPLFNIIKSYNSIYGLYDNVDGEMFNIVK